MTSFEKLTQARTKTGAAVSAFALAKHELETERVKRDSSPELIHDLAQAFRKAEAELNEAIQSECSAVIAAEQAE